MVYTLFHVPTLALSKSGKGSKFQISSQPVLQAPLFLFWFMTVKSPWKRSSYRLLIVARKRGEINGFLGNIKMRGWNGEVMSLQSRALGWLRVGNPGEKIPTETRSNVPLRKVSSFLPRAGCRRDWRRRGFRWIPKPGLRRIICFISQGEGTAAATMLF